METKNAIRSRTFQHYLSFLVLGMVLSMGDIYMDSYVYWGIFFLFIFVSENTRENTLLRMMRDVEELAQNLKNGE